MVTEGCFVSSGGYDETSHDEDTKGGINWGRERHGHLAAHLSSYLPEGYGQRKPLLLNRRGASAGTLAVEDFLGLLLVHVHDIANSAYSCCFPG